MEQYTQLGLAGVTLGILFFTVQYFVKAINHKDSMNYELTQKFIKIAQDNIDTRRVQTEVMKKQVKSTDKLSTIINDLMKKK